LVRGPRGGSGIRRADAGGPRAGRDLPDDRGGIPPDRGGDASDQRRDRAGPAVPAIPAQAGPAPAHAQPDLAAADRAAAAVPREWERQIAGGAAVGAAPLDQLHRDRVRGDWVGAIVTLASLGMTPPTALPLSPPSVASP